jgi:hypothetical protein
MRLPSCLTLASDSTTVSLLRAHAPDFLQSNTTLRLLDNAVELVDLLQCKPFGLVDHEPDESDANEAERSPDLRSRQLNNHIAKAEFNPDLQKTPSTANSHTLFLR